MIIRQFFSQQLDDRVIELNTHRIAHLILEVSKFPTQFVEEI